MNPLRALRAEVHDLRSAHGMRRIEIAERIHQLARDLRDEELLAAVERGRSRMEIAATLGVTHQAVGYRVRHARKRFGEPA